MHVNIYQMSEWARIGTEGNGVFEFPPNIIIINTFNRYEMHRSILIMNARKGWVFNN